MVADRMFSITNFTCRMKELEPSINHTKTHNERNRTVKNLMCFDGDGHSDEDNEHASRMLFYQLHAFISRFGLIFASVHSGKSVKTLIIL